MRVSVPMSILACSLLLCLFAFPEDNFPWNTQARPGDSPLIQALTRGDEKEARRLLENGASPNVPDRIGITPLGASIYLNFPDFAELLIKRGADVNYSVGRRDTSPLALASWHCDFRIVKVLLEHGAQIDHRDLDGETPLGAAAYTCRDGKVIELLLKAGADPNSKANGGYTPLIAAADSGNWVATQLLLDAGADRDVKDTDGTSVRDAVCSKGREDFGKVCALFNKALTSKQH